MENCNKKIDQSRNKNLFKINKETGEQQKTIVSNNTKICIYNADYKPEIATYHGF